MKEQLYALSHLPDCPELWTVYAVQMPCRWAEGRHVANGITESEMRKILNSPLEKGEGWMR